MSKNYEAYEFEDFITDEFFVEWVKHGTAESCFFWNEWTIKHPEKLSEVFKAKQFIESVRHHNKVLPEESEFLQVLENVHKATSSDKSLGTRRLTRWFSAAASIAFFLSAYWWWFWLFGGSPDPGTEPSLVTAKPEIIEKHNPAGQKSVLTLEDGTVVNLNAESTLRLEKHFQAGKREVFLTGEAFFEVSPDSTRPFIIHTGSVSTTVLGTSFNVKSFPEQTSVEVAVVSGKVAVGKSGNPADQVSPVLLKANDVAITALEGNGQIVKRDVDIESHILWRKGILAYEDATFEELKRDIERWYDVKVALAPGLEVRGRYNGYFDNKSLENVMEGLSFLLGLDYTIEGSTVLFQQKKL